MSQRDSRTPHGQEEPHPYGCLHCGDPVHNHGQQYLEGVGLHGWESPTQKQIKERMQDRRAARKETPS